ncbi:MAG: TOBE domain-containing protein [Pseudomonadales bacterium]|nr:TOBE domain-containing protein [Pseudomonadales bacterium]
MAKRSESPSSGAALKGDLFLESADRQSFDSRQITLLQAVKSCGSISSAAKQVGISYKTAWDRLNAMNNISDKPIVNRAAGGPRGGGTRLTDFGEELLSGLQALQEEHAGFVARLGENVQELGDLSRFLRSSNLRTSARNQYRGKIQKVIPGTVNTEVELAPTETLHIVATITNDSFSRMELGPGVEVIALIKSSWVMLSAQTNVATSARNQLPGTINQITKGEVDAEITLDLGGGKSLCSVITAASCDAMQLSEGQEVTALFKASSVILMRP